MRSAFRESSCTGVAAAMCAVGGVSNAEPAKAPAQPRIVNIYNFIRNSDYRMQDSENIVLEITREGRFDSKEPSKLIARLDTPFFKPELDWEKSGQYVAGTTFAEGLVRFKGRWFLYYGCADTFVGVAASKD